MRAVLSLIVAIVTTVAGEALLWGGGSATMRIVQESAVLDARSLVPAIIAVVGIVLVAIAMLTAAWSSLGVIVVGAIHLIVGTAAVLVSPAIYYAVLRPLHQTNADVAGGIDYAAATGMLLLTGVVMFVGGIALAARKPRSSAAGRITSLILGLVLGVGMLPVLAIGGFRVVQSVLIRLSAVVELFGALMVIGAAVLLLIVVITVRWSSLGAFVIGVLIAAAGFVAIFAPTLVFRGLAFDPQIRGGAVYVAGTGQLALLGMLLLATAIAGLVRAAQRRSLEPAPDVDEQIGYQQEQPAMWAPPPPATPPITQPVSALDEVFPPARPAYDPPAAPGGPMPDPPPSDRV
jgi:hypothetical protein